jgi:signal transduction histidine kinase
MDKTSFYASMESIAAHDDTGNSTWIRSAVVDITELKKKEQTLLESEERLKLLSLQLLNTQEEERKRIAGEIHDTVVSSLGGMKFKAESALHQVEKAPGAAVESLNTLILMIQECIDECRRIQMDLRPAILDDLGLRAALSWFFRRFETTYSHIRVEQEIGIEDGETPNALNTVIYRVTQETLNNVVKHSKANHVFFSLKAANEKIELTITDNGKGFDVVEILTKERSFPGLGLVSMRERTRLFGGTFNVTSTEGKGTTVHASWPMSS